jgi:hypothetical protein
MRFLDLRSFLSVAASIAIFAPAAYGLPSSGGESGGGGDYDPAAGHAWFLGPAASVQYCIEIAPNFGASQNLIETNIAAALAKWQQFINQSGTYYYQKRNLSNKFVKQTKCNGHEDLKFYMGVLNTETVSAKNKHVNPVGFAALKSYDSDRGWAKGFIWIAPANSVNPSRSFPKWTREFQLQGILLHEIGHVYGANHMEGTIMTAQIATSLDMDEVQPFNDTQWAYRINSQRMVLFPHDLNFEIPGILGDTYFDDVIQGRPRRITQEQIFQRLVGRSPQGPLQAKVVGNEPTAILLVLSDKLGTHQFEVVVPLVGERNQVFLDGRGMYIFRTSPWPGMDNVAGNYGEIAPGRIKTIQGESLQVIVEVNIPNFNRWDEGPIRINLVTSDQGELPLFKSSKRY